MPPKKRARKEASSEKYEEVLQTLTDDQLRAALVAAGKSPGPVDDSTRDLYIRMLVRKKACLDTTESPLKKETPSKAASKRGQVKSSTVPTNPIKFSVSPSGGTALAQSSSSSFAIKGLCAAPFTPFSDNGELRLSVIERYVDFLLKQGIQNIFVCGSTGECTSMSVEERKLVTEEWIRASRKRMTIIVHVGSENLKNSCQLASHAAQSGADAIGAMPPSYFKPPSLESLVLYLEKVAEAAPSLPMFYYHIPIRSGVSFSMEELLDLASSRLPTLRGIKFTDKDLMEFSRCVAHSGGKYHMMYGCDEQVLGSLSMGGTAAVGTTYNFCGKLNNRLFEAYQRKDLEAALLEQRRSQAAIKLLMKYGGISAGKAFMKMRGLDVGPPRLPFLPLSAEDYKTLQSDLTSIGFFKWA